MSFCTAAAPRTAAAASGEGVGAAVGGGKQLEGEDIMVYQYKICPFCNKLKAVMDYLGIPYKVTEVRVVPEMQLPLCYFDVNISTDFILI